MLPALHGDALLLEYGPPDTPHHVLVDGGPRSNITREAIAAALRQVRGLDLLVVTHVDADHITGVLRMLEHGDLPDRIGDVWFNGWHHLPSDQLGVKQGERLSKAIRKRRLPWNAAFDGGAVMVPDTGPLPVRELPGGLRLTLLSPTRQALADLRPAWKEVVEEAEPAGPPPVHERPVQPDRLGDKPLDPDALAAAPFAPDDSEANGSSIAFLAEFDGRSVILTGDAHCGVLVPGLRRLAAGNGRVSAGALKVPHHGSAGNVSGELLDILDCRRFVFSTNGAIYGHPDRTAIARIVTRIPGSRLEFNYRTPSLEPWESARLRRRWRYETVFGDVDGHLLVRL